MAPKEAQWSAVTNHRPGESTGEFNSVQITQLKRAKLRMSSRNAQPTATESCWFIFQVNVSMFSCCIKEKNIWSHDPAAVLWFFSKAGWYRCRVQWKMVVFLCLQKERGWFVCLMFGGFCSFLFPSSPTPSLLSGEIKFSWMFSWNSQGLAQTPTANRRLLLITETAHYSLSLILSKSQEVNIPLYSLSAAIRALVPPYSSQGFFQSQGTVQHLLSHFLCTAFNSQYTETQPTSAITVTAFNFKLFSFFFYML